MAGGTSVATGTTIGSVRSCVHTASATQRDALWAGTVSVLATGSTAALIATVTTVQAVGFCVDTTTTTDRGSYGRTSNLTSSIGTDVTGLTDFATATAVESVGFEVNALSVARSLALGTNTLSAGAVGPARAEIVAATTV